MNKTRRTAIKAVMAAAFSMATAALTAQTPVGQWDFDQGNLNATIGTALQYLDGPGGMTQTATTFGTTTASGIDDILGVSAKVMGFPANAEGMGYLMNAPLAANGAGGLVNNYTLVFDLYYPASSDHKVRPLIQTDDGGLSGVKTAIVIDSSNGIGSQSGPFQGEVKPNTWYRLGLVFNSDSGKIQKYLNGQEVGDEAIGNPDGAYALVPGYTALLFGNNDTNSASGYVNNAQLWDVALNPGQMLALGAPTAGSIPSTIPPIPSYVASRTPAVSAVNVEPMPHLLVELMQGDTSITQSSIKLYMDGEALAATISSVNGGYTIEYTPANVLLSTSTHDLSLVYGDSVAGLQTNNWSFTVTHYQVVNLPAPLHIETFDEVPEGVLPDGWSVTNNTAPQVSGFDLTNPKSDSYMDFVTISAERLGLVFDHRRLQLPPIVLNGVLLDSLVSNNFLYAESDQRQNAGGQVQVAFSPDYDLTGKSNIFLAFKCSYEQNQDNIGSVEYSIDNGATWLPVVYYIDDQNQSADVIRTNGVIDVAATFGTARSDQSYGLSFSNFIGAVVSTNLIPYVAGRINDDPLDGKRIEVIRLAQADGQAKVRFRIGQAGTSSWYFGVDDFGLYSINKPVITAQPASQSIDAGTAATFSVAATSSTPVTYQWQYKGRNITDATNSTYTLTNVAPDNAGLYLAVVSNSDGPVTSDPANLTVVTVPQIVSSPISQFISAQADASISGEARGGRPLGVQWYFNNAPLAGATLSSLVLNNAQETNTGSYYFVATNSYGFATSAVATVTVFTGAITNGLVAHLKFDGDYSDSSGRGNNASAVGTPGFAPGKVGQAFKFTTMKDGSTINYATLGAPADLNFGTNSFTVSFWVNCSDQVDDPAFISNKDWNSSNNRGWGIFAQGGGNFRINATGPSGSADKFDTTLAPTIRDGTWHLIAVSFWRGQNVHTYLDGALVQAKPFTTSGSLDTDDLGKSINIGQDGTGAYTDGGSAQIVDGLIDDVGIWNRVVTEQEVAAIYNAGQAGKDLTQGTTQGAIKLSYALSNHSLQLNWTGNSSTKLQMATQLGANADWTDVANTLGASSATIPANGTTYFFRIAQ